MLEVLTQLLQVQERDQRILKFQKDLKDIPQQQARAQMQLAGDQAALDKATQAVKEIEVKIKGIELDINTRNTSIKRLQDQQFETRKNDEFSALGHEIERYKKDVSALEDSELEQMEALEAAKGVVKTAQAKLGETQARVNVEVKALEERAAGVKSRLDDLLAERAKLVEPVDPDALELYSRIMNKKSDPVVAVEGGVCRGCHVKVVSSTIQSLRQGTGLTHCDSCGRILYLIE
jgi:predicted  nucleic acid-binding Zn-ribbon protein